MRGLHGAMQVLEISSALEDVAEAPLQNVSSESLLDIISYNYTNNTDLHTIDRIRNLTKADVKLLRKKAEALAAEEQKKIRQKAAEEQKSRKRRNAVFRQAAASGTCPCIHGRCVVLNRRGSAVPCGC